MSQPVRYGTHRLVNRRTGRLACQSNWLLDLAACAVEQGHAAGLPALLPQKRAAKLLVHNRLQPFRRRSQATPAGFATSHEQLRQLAQDALPSIVTYYISNDAQGKKPSEVNRKGFVNWLVREIANPSSGLCRHLHASRNFGALAETTRRPRWWLDQLKMQSKRHKRR